MRVFVVGATGVLGRPALQRLEECGHRVVVVARLLGLGFETHCGACLAGSRCGYPAALAWRSKYAKGRSCASCQSNSLD